MENSLELIIKEKGWVIHLDVKNRTKKPIDMDGLKVSFSSVAKINGKGEPGAIWGDETWDAKKTVQESLQADGKIKTVITLDWGRQKLLNPGAVQPVSFGLNTLEELEQLRVWAKNDPNARQSITLQAPEIPDEELDGYKSRLHIREQSLGYDEKFELDWKEERKIKGLFPGNYQITLQTIETEKASYIHQWANGDTGAITVSLSDDESAEKSLSWLITTRYKAHVTFCANSLPEAIPLLLQFEPIQIETTILEAGSNKIVQRALLPAGCNMEFSLFSDTTYSVIFQKVTINSKKYALDFAERSAYKPATGKNRVNLKLKITDKETNNLPQVTIETRGLEGLENSLSPIPIHLRSLDKPNIHYFYFLATKKKVEEEKERNTFAVEEGVYEVDVNTVIAKDKTSYKPNLNESLVSTSVRSNTTSPKNSYIISFKPQIPLRVKNWPSYLAHGGITDGRSSIVDGYLREKCPIDALFRYAGQNGGGDRGQIIDPKIVTERMLSDANQIRSFQNRPVVVVLVIYTADLSGGVNNTDFIDLEILKKHYINLINEARVAKNYAHYTPISFVMNPDMIGMLQQNRNHSDINRLFEADSIPVMEAIYSAYFYLGIREGIIGGFPNDIYGYIQSINWIIRYFAPGVSFGWQFNVWQTGEAHWTNRSGSEPEQLGEQAANFIKALGVYEGPNRGDFIVFDKYERDDFSYIARFNGYAWGAEAWKRYMRHVAVVSDLLALPLMLWQIPGGHLPTIAEGDAQVRGDHAGSGASFFMGDKRIGSDLKVIDPSLLNLNLENPQFYKEASTVGDILERDKGYHWGYSQLKNAVLSNVFAILWGGGSTTSVISYASGTDDTWLTSQLKNYYNNPLLLPGAKNEDKK